MKSLLLLATNFQQNDLIFYYFSSVFKSTIGKTRVIIATICSSSQKNSFHRSQYI